MHTELYISSNVSALTLAGCVAILFFQLVEFYFFFIISIWSFHCFKGWFSYLSISSFVVWYLYL
jgi:hypothetical protein